MLSENERSLQRICIVIPSLNPDGKLIRVVQSIRAIGFTRIIVVNDGSKEACIAPFEECTAYPEVKLLTHEVNRGKGAAIKTALSYVQTVFPDAAGVITVDGDGQHHAEDVLACANALLSHPDHVILGARDFSKSDVPFRSRFGNRLTSLVFLTGVGLHIQDTQTGLRALPASHFTTFLQTKGDRYEYETNMLLDMKQYHIPFDQVTIQTIYIDENQTSHFHPIRDSARIYAQILKFCAGSAISTLVDYLLFLLISALTKSVLTPTQRIFVATVGARIISSLVNFWCNRQLVFTPGGKVLPSFVKYYCLAIPQMLLSAGMVQLLTRMFRNTAVILTTVMKMIVDTVLFFASYLIQKKWVFHKD